MYSCRWDLPAAALVIVSEDGYILTAGHVSGTPGRDITIVMPDGTTHPGKTLGGNGTIDSGLVKITESGKWPFVEIEVFV